jgi:pimeloyl-ACP methyl ester carboxylesterase
VKGRLAYDERFPAGVAGVRTRTVRSGDGTALFVVECGPESGPPVLLLHGWGASIYLFAAQLTALGAAGYRAVAPDLRGHGRSAKPSGPGQYAPASFLDDATQVLDALSIERAAVVGQSMGGAIAIELALRFPHRVAALALINPIGIERTILPRVGRLFGRPLATTASPVMVRRWMIRRILRHLVYAEPGRPTARDVDEYWAPSADPGWGPAVYAALREFAWEPYRAEQLASLNVPTLAILGRSDRVIRHRITAVPGAPRVRLEYMAGGHAVNEDRPDEVNAILLTFLARAWGGQG